MKKLLATLLGATVCYGVFAQGTVNFANIGTGPNGTVNAAIRDVGGSPALGNTFMASLWYLSGGVYVDSGVKQAFSGAGYFSGGEKVVTGVPSGVATSFQLRVYPNTFSDWATALATGTAATHISPSDLVLNPAFTLTLADPTVVPKPAPPILVGLTSHNLVPAPEPSTILLGMAGIGGLLFLRRKMA